MSAIDNAPTTTTTAPSAASEPPSAPTPLSPTGEAVLAIVQQHATDIDTLHANGEVTWRELSTWAKANTDQIPENLRALLTGDKPHGFSWQAIARGSWETISGGLADGLREGKEGGDYYAFRIDSAANDAASESSDAAVSDAAGDETGASEDAAAADETTAEFPAASPSTPGDTSAGDTSAGDNVPSNSAPDLSADDSTSSLADEANDALADANSAPNL